MKILSSILIIALIAVGCSNSPNNNAAFGDLQIQAVTTNSPAELASLIPENTESIMLHVLEVSVKKTDGEGWMVVSSGAVTVDFLKLSEGILAELSDISLEEGKYNQVRLLLGEENAILIDGSPHPLIIPSGTETGVKLNLNFDIEENLQTEIKIDIRTDQSVVTAGSTFILRPTYNAFLDE